MEALPPKRSRRGIAAASLTVFLVLAVTLVALRERVSNSAFLQVKSLVQTGVLRSVEDPWKSSVKFQPLSDWSATAIVGVSIAAGLSLALHGRRAESPVICHGGRGCKYSHKNRGFAFPLNVPTKRNGPYPAEMNQSSGLVDEWENMYPHMKDRLPTYETLYSKATFNSKAFNASFVSKLAMGGESRGPVNLAIPYEEKMHRVKQRAANLHKLIGMTNDDFDMEVKLIKKEWSSPWGMKPLLSGYYRSQQKMRRFKMAQSFLKENWVFKPLALRHPALFTNDNRKPGKEGYSKEKFDWEMDPDTVLNAERIAGFSYEDWVTEYKGLNSFTGYPSVGELVSGTIVGFSQENKASAYVEMDPKVEGGAPYRTWGYLPLNKIRVAPLLTATDHFSIGDKIEAMVVGLTKDSRTEGDGNSRQVVLSTRELEMGDALSELKPGSGNSSKSVTVVALKEWGAVVMTERGIYGGITRRDLPPKENDLSLIGKTLTVQVERFGFDPAKLEKSGGKPPEMLNDCGVFFTCRNTANKELASRLLSGQVVTCTVKEISKVEVILDLEGLTCFMPRADVSGITTTFELVQVFEVGEVIKCFVMDSDPISGRIKLSTRALETQLGEMLTNKERVFKNAEKVAKAAALVMQQQKESFQKQVNVISLGVDSSDDEGETETRLKKAPKAPESAEPDTDGF